MEVDGTKMTEAGSSDEQHNMSCSGDLGGEFLEDQASISAGGDSSLLCRSPAEKRLKSDISWDVSMMSQGGEDRLGSDCQSELSVNAPSSDGSGKSPDAKQKAEKGNKKFNFQPIF